jgi:hypothetical protein
MKEPDILHFVEEILKRYRAEIFPRPELKSVQWKGIGMSREEAKVIIKELEEQKLILQESMNKVQTGGEITNLASSGAGIAAMVTGATLLLFPPTAIAGVITLVSGAGTAGIGKMVGDGVKEIGKNSNTQKIKQIDDYIDSLKNAIIDSID